MGSLSQSQLPARFKRRQERPFLIPPEHQHGTTGGNSHEKSGGVHPQNTSIHGCRGRLRPTIDDADTGVRVETPLQGRLRVGGQVHKRSLVDSGLIIRARVPTMDFGRGKRSLGLHGHVQTSLRQLEKVGQAGALQTPQGGNREGGGEQICSLPRQNHRDLQ